MAPKTVIGPEIERLIQLLAKIPGLGPRSARRAALHLIKKRHLLLEPLTSAMAEAAQTVKICEVCGSIDTISPCTICSDARRDPKSIIIVEDVGDLWALERADVANCKYHVLGGVLSPLDGVGPDQLNLTNLLERLSNGDVEELIIAVNATMEGQTTAHYITDMVSSIDIKVTRLAHGVPVGGELDYLDEGTLAAAIKSRSELTG